MIDEASPITNAAHKTMLTLVARSRAWVDRHAVFFFGVTGGPRSRSSVCRCWTFTGCSPRISERSFRLPTHALDYELSLIPSCHGHVARSFSSRRRGQTTSQSWPSRGLSPLEKLRLEVQLCPSQVHGAQAEHHPRVVLTCLQTRRDVPTSCDGIWNVCRRSKRKI